LIDPQSDYNKRRSTMLEMLIRYASKGYIVQRDAIDDYESDWLEPEIGGIKRIKDIGMYKVEEVQSVSPDLIRDAQESKILIDEISSVNKSVKGQAEFSNEPARAFIAKRDQGMQSLQHLYDNLDFSSKILFGNSIKLVQAFDTEEKILRLVNEDTNEPEEVGINQEVQAISPYGEVVTQIMNDLSVGEYDVEISNAPYGNNAREVEYLKVLDLYNLVKEVDPQKAAQMFPIMVKLNDSSVKQELMKIFSPEQQQQNLTPEQQQAMQEEQQAMNMQRDLALEELALKNEKLKVEIEEKEIGNKGKLIENQGKKVSIASKLFRGS
jgi:hypothetical protein